MRDLKTEYQAKFCSNVQSLVTMRNNLRITQSQIAYKSKVSLRTIQNFENYKSNNYYLIFAYQQIFNELKQ